MQADGVVALRRHMQSCDAHRCRHEEVCSISDQQLDDLGVAIKGRQVKRSGSKLRPVAEVYVVSQTALKPTLLRLLDLPIDQLLLRVGRAVQIRASLLLAALLDEADN